MLPQRSGIILSLLGLTKKGRGGQMRIFDVFTIQMRHIYLLVPPMTEFLCYLAMIVNKGDNAQKDFHPTRLERY